MLRRTSRTLMSGLFMAEGIEQVTRPVPDPDAPPRIPLVDDEQATSAVRVGGALQVAGAVMLVTDVTPRLGAGLIGIGLLPSTAAGLNGGALTRSEQARFVLRNLALVGATTIAALDTQGEPGIGWRAGRLAHDAGREAEWRRREAELLSQLAMAKASAKATEARARTVTPARQVVRDARTAGKVVRVVSWPVRKAVRKAMTDGSSRREPARRRAHADA